MTKPSHLKKERGVQLIGRVAGLNATLLLMDKPYRATELAKELNVQIRVVYRILNDLRATGNLYSHRCYYWFDPKKNNNLEHLIPVKDPYL
jgi:predicted DNA-binding transcriptional regulator YafY